MNTALVLATVEGSEAASHATIPPIAFGVVAFVSLIALLAITYAFRSVGSRHH